MKHYRVPGVSVAVIRNGRTLWARGYGVKTAGTADRVNVDTVFSVGSLSKIVAATATLRLVSAGRLDLDRDANDFLGQRWRIPGSAFTTIRPVTLRGILSHTSGLTVHGFDDFLPGESLPTVIDTLEGRPPAKNEPVRVVFAPGTRWSYSGGGATVEQLIIEETTGMPFAAAASHLVFEPLRMKRSTFENPLPEQTRNVARAHDEHGALVAQPRGWQAFPEMAASGLWTTPSDYAQLAIALLEAYRGAAESVIPRALARDMMTEVSPSPFGLGPALDGRGASRRFFHDGANDSYRAWVEVHLDSGNGVVVFTNGANGAELIREIRRAVAVSEGWPLPAPLTVDSARAPEARLRDFTGIYEVIPPAELVNVRLGEYSPAYQVRLEATGLYLSAPDEAGVPLLPVDATHFVAPNVFFDYAQDQVEVEFIRNYGDGIDRLALRYDGYLLEARKIVRPAAGGLSLHPSPESRAPHAVVSNR